MRNVIFAHIPYVVFRGVTCGLISYMIIVTKKKVEKQHFAAAVHQLALISVMGILILIHIPITLTQSMRPKSGCMACDCVALNITAAIL